MTPSSYFDITPHQLYRNRRNVKVGPPNSKVDGTITQYKTCKINPCGVIIIEMYCEI